MIKNLETLIKEPLGKFCPKEKLNLVLKRRLTKKEYKTLLLKIQNFSNEKIKNTLNLPSFEITWKKIIKKLNSHKIKKELFCKEELL